MNKHIKIKIDYYKLPTGEEIAITSDYVFEISNLDKFLNQRYEYVVYLSYLFGEENGSEKFNSLADICGIKAMHLLDVIGSDNNYNISENILEFLNNYY